MTTITSRNPSVALVNNQATTTSTAVAEFFAKRHKNVLQAIDNLECSHEYRALNFQPTFQVIEMPNGAKREERIFTMTRDGFALLAMGFTGKEAMQWKIAYLEAFNKMEAALIAQQQPALPQLITPAQQNTLQQIVAFKAGESGGLRAYCWSRFNNHFHLGSYKQLPAAYFDEAVAYLKSMPMKKEPALAAPVIQPSFGMRILTRFEGGSQCSAVIVANDALVMSREEFEAMLKSEGKVIVPAETVNIIKKLQLLAA